jgi:DNA-binding NtrC family response regulator
MKVNVYLVRDTNYTTVNAFTSKLKAITYSSHNKNTEIERVEVDIPDAATREIHHINLKYEPEVIVKTMKQLVDSHIEYVLYSVCEGNVAKAARMLDMSDTNLRHKIKQLGSK